MKSHFLFLFSFIPLSYAYEVDNFTQRYHPLPESLELLDQEINRRIKHAMIELNKDKKSCNKVDVISYVSEEFSGHIVGAIESWVLKNNGIKKNEIDLEKSIYKSRSVKDKLQGGVLSAAGLEPSIKLNNQYIGIDKLGHFFDQGYAQYLIAYNNGSGVEAALKRGVSQEETYLGWATTGVKSYGDLAANYSGMMFYKNLIDGDAPYFKCINSKWEITRNFSFQEYVNPTWDEAINCSEYNTESLQAVLLKNGSELEKKNPGKKFNCPVDEKACQSFSKIFPENFLSHIVTPACRASSSPLALPEMCQQRLSPSIISPNFTNFCEKVIGKLK